MSPAFDKAAAVARQRRAALLQTFGELRARASPPQLVEDALRVLDPELSFLGRLKKRVRNNRLLSLAVLAGVGWLVGSPRHDKRRTVRGAESRHAKTASKHEGDER